MTVERREEKVGKPLSTGSALGGDKFHDICDMETIPPETDVLINNAKIPISKVLNNWGPSKWEFWRYLSGHLLTIIVNEVNLLFSSLYCRLDEKLSLKKRGIKQCLGGLKCSQNAKKNKKRLKISFKALFNANFINLVSKEYFSYNVL